MKHFPPVITLLIILLTANSLPAAEAPPAPPASAQTAFEPGKPWLDTRGQPIRSHAGGILERDGVYYWYGQERAGRPSGVTVYRSRDLLNWEPLGLALARDTLPEESRQRGVCERPKVLWNAKTRRYVMWMHLDNPQYTYAMAGVAVCDKPEGPFQFLEAFRPVRYDFGYPENDRCRQKELGNTFRDMNLFLDDDGKAYVFYASEDNRTMYVVQLNEEFTRPAEPLVQGRTWARILADQYREAPAPFKFRNKYYLITSGCTGWNPNAADLSVANSLFGPWTSRGNPCVGPERHLTFRAQSTFVLPAPGKPPGCFIFMADRWEPKRLEQSTHVWLPFVLRNDTLLLEFRERWDFSVFDALSAGP
jgi:hypothetical protein